MADGSEMKIMKKVATIIFEDKKMKMNKDKNELINETDIRNNIDIIFKKISKLLIKLIPDAKIEHVGSTAIPGSITKGDIDIQVRIDQSQFTKAKNILNQYFEIDIINPATKDYCGFIDRKSKITLSIQLTVIDSKSDDFYKIRDIIKKNKKLLKEYNEIKKKYHNKSIGVYRKEKEKFFKKITKK